MPIPQPPEEFPIINAHAHTFTKDHTPKYIAKRFIPWPLYWILETSLVLPIIKKYLNRNKKNFSHSGKLSIWNAYLREKTFTENAVLGFLRKFFLVAIWLVFLYYVLDLIKPLLPQNLIWNWLSNLRIKYLDPIMPNEFHGIFKVLILLGILLIFQNIRNGIKKILWAQLKKIIGKQELEFLLRYINIVRFANKKWQANIFNDLEQQYPPETKFVVLPMDMEFMDAGPIKKPYLEQMKELFRLKKKNPKAVYPFIFVDPRRMVVPTTDTSFLTRVSNWFSKILIAIGVKKKPKIYPNVYGKDFFDYDDSKPEKIVLKPCLIKTCLDKGCIGIKIYPALGYYPFDELLLPLWLYCVQNDIPITTHCSVGPIFYRGDKKEEWDRHPIFEEAVDKDPLGNQIIENLRLGQIKNKDFQRNFTHPLNFVCLLDEYWLKKVLDKYKNSKLNKMFGYRNGNLDRNLSSLKINLAHFGGSENWDQFLAQDRYPLANKIINSPKKMLNLSHEMLDVDTFYPLWHYVDWFSIISSMIMQFDNIYADISYTVHDTKYLNLLSEIMNRPKAEERLLYGTDFFVVSNQKADKQYWIDMKNILSTRKWYMLANRNPNRFLISTICPKL